MARIAGIDLPKKQKRSNRTYLHLWYWTKYFKENSKR